MKRRPTTQTRADAFEMVGTVGLALPDVEATTKYDGSPVLKLGGSFMAGLATHPSAEPDTLVVRVDYEEREWLIEDAPETYYLTDYYRRYPLVLAQADSSGPNAVGMAFANLGRVVDSTRDRQTGDGHRLSSPRVPTFWTWKGRLGQVEDRRFQRRSGI